jgi:hypothetical protein
MPRRIQKVFVMSALSVLAEKGPNLWERLTPAAMTRLAGELFPMREVDLE